MREVTAAYEQARSTGQLAGDLEPPQRMTADLELRAAAHRLKGTAMPFADHPDYRAEWRYERPRDN
jgi:hypothetical protein